MFTFKKTPWMKTVFHEIKNDLGEEDMDLVQGKIIYYL